MSKYFSFNYEAVDDLGSQLSRGLTGYALKPRANGRLDTLWIFLPNKTLEIRAEITPVDDWEEIGTLQFRCLPENEPCPDKTLIPSSWLEIASISKLLVEDKKFKAECGIVIKNTEGNNLFIVVGALPLTIELKANFYENNFQPECNINMYSTSLIFKKT